jgi:hypothetical protein
MGNGRQRGRKYRELTERQAKGIDPRLSSSGLTLRELLAAGAGRASKGSSEDNRRRSTARRRNAHAALGFVRRLEKPGGDGLSRALPAPVAGRAKDWSCLNGRFRDRAPRTYFSPGSGGLLGMGQRPGVRGKARGRDGRGSRSYEANKKNHKHSARVD